MDSNGWLLLLIVLMLDLRLPHLMTDVRHHNASHGELPPSLLHRFLTKNVNGVPSRRLLLMATVMDVRRIPLMMDVRHQDE